VIRSGEKRSLALPEGFYPTHVVWFPDGTRLLVGRGDASLFSISILGGTPQKIVDNIFGRSSISPDGSLIAFNRGEPERQSTDIWLVGANGESPRRIRATSGSERVGYFSPIWSRAATSFLHADR